jgi:hypothetical protein
MYKYKPTSDMIWVYKKQEVSCHPVAYCRIVACQSIATQRLDKHPAIRARNSRTNVYVSLQRNSQRANGLATKLSRDLFSVVCATQQYNCFLRCPCSGYIKRCRLQLRRVQQLTVQGREWSVNCEDWVQIRTEEYWLIEDKNNNKTP